MTLRVLLVDDHAIVRDGLRALLTKQSDIEVVAEASDGKTAVRLAGEVSPDVVVMDVALPELSGIDATQQIAEEHPEVKVLALSMHTDKRYVVSMLRAGAAGYLLKDSAFDELVRAIRQVHRGETYLGTRVASVVVDDYLDTLSRSAAAEPSVLTARERQVLKLVAEGKSTKDIAAALSVSAKTVETHRAHLMSKLQLRSVAELTKYAIRHGLTSLE